jgi:radical SAM superfamily enzyme YgiQ (UPF0313 family)
VDFEKKIQEVSPDLVVVSCTEDMYPIAVPLLTYLGKNRPPVVAGGTFPTFMPELTIRRSNSSIDFAVVGEGEEVLLELCRKLGKDDIYTIDGLCWIDKDDVFHRNPTPKPVDVATLPLPDFSIFDDDIFYRPMQGKIWRMLPVTTIRGCPYKCAYCNAPSTMDLHKDSGYKYLRKQRADLVHREIKHFIDTYKADSVYFWAETFLAWSNSEFEEFCEMYSDFKLPFWIQTRAETVTRPKFQKIKDLGVLRVGFGIEHGNEKFREKMLQRRVKNSLMIENLNIVSSDLNIPISVNNLVGFPKENRELAFETIELNRQIRSDGINAYTFTPFNGIPLRRISEKLGYIEKDKIVGSVMGKSQLNMPDMTPDEIEGIRRCFVLYTKLPHERWGEIRLAENLNDEGDKKYEELRRECLEQYMFYGDYDEELSATERAPVLPAKNGIESEGKTISDVESMLDYNM